MKDDIKSLRLIHLAVSAGMILIYFMVGEPTIEKLSTLTLDRDALICLGLSIAAILLSHFIFKYHLKQVDVNAPPEAVFANYRVASISRWGVLEAAAILILFLRPDLLIFGVIIILFIVFLSPSEERMQNEFRSRNT